MRFYKAWAHQLFPRAPFKEFVYKSQKLCRERRMRAGLEGMYHEYRFGASGTNLSGETVGEGRGGVYGRDGDNRDGDGNVSHGDAFHEDVELDRAMAEANVRVGAPLNNGAAAVAAAEISAEQLARIQENRERVVKRRFGDHASERTDDPHLKQALARMAERQRLRKAEEAMKRRQEEEEQDAAMRMLNDVDAEAMGGLPDEDEEAMAMEMEKRDLEMQQRDLDMERTTVAHVDAETEADNAPIDLIEEQE